MPAQSLKARFAELMDAQRATEELLRLPDAELLGVARDVSEWSPAQHAFHLSHVARQVAAILKKIEADKGVVHSGSPNLRGVFVLGAGAIPRGKGKAPESTMPPPNATRAQITEALAKSKESLASLEARLDSLCERKGRVPHAVLGEMNAEEWSKFAGIHARHHLEIVEDIRAALAKGTKKKK
jgi:hypothetical protein